MTRDYPFLFTWTAQREAAPVHLTGGHGPWVMTRDGSEWLDMSSLVYQVNAGHGHRRIVEAVRAQADRLCVSLPDAVYPEKTELARRLLELAPDGFSKVFFTLGGAEANEHALKMARLYTGRHKVVSRYRSYHGATMGAMSVSGDWRRRGLEPGMPGVVRVNDFDCPECPHGVRAPDCVHEPRSWIPRTLAHEANVGAVILETIVGGNGVLIPPAGYLDRVRAACDEHGALLVLDEVLTGFGRTGRWLALDHYGVTPDLITLGKALTSGYGTLGAVLVHDRLARYFDTHKLVSGLTHYAHPLGVAAALEAIRVYDDEELVTEASRLESVLRAEVEDVQRRHRAVRQSRAIGLLAVLELALDGAAWTRLRQGLHARRVLSHLSPQRGTLIVAPPLCIGETTLRQGMARIDQALAEAHS